MNDKDPQEIFGKLGMHPDFPEDPDLRIDYFGFIVERHSHGAAHSFGWRVDDQDRIIGNVAGKPPLMG